MAKKIRILLVEDDEEQALIFKKVLESVLKKRFALEWIKDAGELHETIRSGHLDPPDIIFLDPAPGKGGFAPLEELKKDPKLSKIPVVIYTTSSRHSDFVRARELGAAGYIIKPMLIEDLKEELKRILLSAGLLGRERNKK